MIYGTSVLERKKNLPSNNKLLIKIFTVTYIIDQNALRSSEEIGNTCFFSLCMHHWCSLYALRKIIMNVHACILCPRNICGNICGMKNSELLKNCFKMFNFEVVAMATPNMHHLHYYFSLYLSHSYII